MTIHTCFEQPLQATARALDQFYTNPLIAEKCYARLSQAFPAQPGDLWIEPSAGAGAFLAHLPEPRIGLDLAPAAPGIVRADYLNWVPPGNFGRHVVVGNPPFGRNASLAINFFNHAASHADVIAMILPRSVRKSSLRRRLNRMFHLVDEMLLPEEAFLYEGQPYAVRTVFQIWERRGYERSEQRGAVKHPDFSFCNAEEADFAIRRIGGVAGRMFDNPIEHTPSSHLFLKAIDRENAQHLRARFAQLDFSEVREDSVANYSVAKSDVVALYDALLVAGG